MKPLLRILLAFLCFFSLTATIYSQTAGFIPFESYNQYDFDTVNLGRGGVSLHIPLVRYPQRGKLKPLGFDVVINSPTWTQRNVWINCGSGGSGPCDQTSEWSPNNPTIDGGILLNPYYRVSYIDDTSTCTELGCQACVNSNNCQFSLPAVIDGSGALHALYNVALADGTSTGMLATADGTGLVASSNGNGVFPKTVTDKDGITYGNSITGSTFLMKDLDGNQITYTQTGVSDSVGRQIPLFQENSNTPGCETQNFPAFDGQSAPITICWTMYTVNFGIPNQTYVTGSYLNISSVNLPNGESWIFNYDTWGSISSVTTPTGATISYTYYPQYSMGNCNGVGSSCTWARQVETRTITSDGVSNTWNYAYGAATSPIQYEDDPTTTVTDPLGNQTVYIFGFGCYQWLCPTEVTRSYYDSSHKILEKVDTTYADLGIVNPSAPAATSKPPNEATSFPKTVTTTLYDAGGNPASVNQTCSIYDNNTNTTCTGTDAFDSAGLRYYDPNYTLFFPGNTPQLFPLVLGSVVQSYVYDYGVGASGNLLEHEVTAYKWQTDSSYFSANLLNLVSADSLYDASGTLQSQMTYGYDEPNGSPQGALGNQTSVTRWLSTGQSPRTMAIYNSQGMPTTAVDPKGNQTIISYDSTGAYPQQTSRPVTNGIQHNDHYVFDTNTGLISSHTDENLQTTTYHFDRSNRLTGVTYPSGGGTETYQYQDIVGSLGFMHSRTLSSTQAYVEQGSIDGLGRKTRLAVTSDSAGTDYTDTYYDSDNRVSGVSNSYRVSGSNLPIDPTNGVTSYSYDGLNRPTMLCNQDNGTWPSACVEGNSYKAWQYSGNRTTLIDELGNAHIKTKDALGRLVDVIEPGNLETKYTYDLHGLKQVNQLGQPGTDIPVMRFFAYDSLSRLLWSSNPETGLICYGQGGGTPANCQSNGYDLNGNLLYRTNATGITAGYSYDALNRITQKSYNDSTPTVNYSYDISPIGGAANTSGRLTEEQVVANSNVLISDRQAYAYDAMGRVQQLLECTPANCSSDPYHLAYTYDWAGNITASTNGIPNAPYSGVPSDLSTMYGSSTANFNSRSVPSVLLSNVYDSGGRLNSITSSWADAANHPFTLFQVSAYTPNGSLLNAQLGLNAQTLNATVGLTRSYDDRLRVTSETDTGNLLTGTSGTPSQGTIVISGTEGQVLAGGTYASADITVSGTEHGRIVCVRFPASVNRISPEVTPPPPPPVCNEVYDTGNLSVTVNGFTASATYAQGSDDPSIAAALAQAFGSLSSPVVGSPVTGSSSGNVLTVTSLAVGAVGNSYPITISNGTDFTATDSGSTLSGGIDSGDMSDAGTVQVSLNGSLFQATWGATDRPETIASQLFSMIHDTENGTFLVTLSGAQISISSIAVGSAGNVPISCSVSDQMTQSPSFGASCSGLTGGTDPQTSQVAVYHYSGIYQANGNLSSVSDSVVGDWTYGYDSLNRLNSAIATSGVYGGSPVGGVSFGWSYDSFGNRKGQTSNSGLYPTMTEYIGGNNQITGIGLANTNSPTNVWIYDGLDGASGNVTYDGTNHYLYDAEGRLCATSSGSGGYVQYIYDGEGNRIAKGTVSSLSCDLSINSFTATNSYVIGVAGEQLTEFQSQSGQWNWVHSNIYNGPLLGTYSGNNTYFALNDWLGTKRVQISPDGLINTYSNLPFGDAQAATGNTADATEQHLTGKERDTETGLDFFGARYYASTVGRWMSPDWSSAPIPIPYAHLDDPQTLNLYSYTSNNPLSRKDIGGHDTDGNAPDPFALDALVFSSAARVIPGNSEEKPPACTATNCRVTARIVSVGLHQSIWSKLGSFFGFSVVHAQEFEKLPTEDVDTYEPPEITPLEGMVYPEPPTLPVYHARNFEYYSAETLRDPMTLWRTYGGSADMEGKDGTYYSIFPPEGSPDAIRQLFAILPEWGNTLEKTDSVQIPTGTLVFIGPAAQQTSETGETYSGGGLQVYVPKQQ